MKLSGNLERGVWGAKRPLRLDYFVTNGTIPRFEEIG